MASFGTETETVFTDTNKTLNTIFSAANMLSRHYWQRQGRVQMEADEFQRHLDEMHRHEGILWDHQSDDDVIRSELATIQNQLETVTKPCFEEPMKTYGIFTKKWPWFGD